MIKYLKIIVGVFVLTSFTVPLFAQTLIGVIGDTFKKKDGELMKQALKIC